MRLHPRSSLLQFSSLPATVSLLSPQFRRSRHSLCYEPLSPFPFRLLSSFRLYAGYSRQPHPLQLLRVIDVVVCSFLLRWVLGYNHNARLFLFSPIAQFLFPVSSSSAMDPRFLCHHRPPSKKFEAAFKEEPPKRRPKRRNCRPKNEQLSKIAKDRQEGMMRCPPPWTWRNFARKKQWWLEWDPPSTERWGSAGGSLGCSHSCRLVLVVVRLPSSSYLFSADGRKARYSAQR